MKSSNKSKVVPIIGILLLLGSVGYFFFGRNTEPVETTTLVKSKATPGSASVQEDLLKILNEVKKIKLSREIFKNPYIGNSIDFTKELTLEPKVRPNPFAPIDTDSIGSRNAVSVPALAPAVPTAPSLAPVKPR